MKHKHVIAGNEKQRDGSFVFCISAMMDIVVQQQTLIVRIRYSFEYFPSFVFFQLMSISKKKKSFDKQMQLIQISRVGKGHESILSKGKFHFYSCLFRLKMIFDIFFYVSRKCHGINF